jgi:NADH-quinone oxidoreductase subunit N
MRLLVDGLHPAVGDWQGMLAIMAVLSLAIGNLAAIMQTNIKRMLAYSTISHMGFLLLGILSGTFAGYSAAMFYVIAYVLMSLGSFGLVVYLSQNGLEAEHLDDFKGLNSRHPWLAALMAILMFSMAGMPPFVGFYAKLAILQSLVGAGFLWLAVVAVMFSLIGAFYYLRVVKMLYFDAPKVDRAGHDAGLRHPGAAVRQRPGGPGARHPAPAPHYPLHLRDADDLAVSRRPLAPTRLS